MGLSHFWGKTTVELTVLSFLLCQCFNTGMAPRMDDVMRLCCEISAHDQIKVAVRKATMGAMVAGGTAFVGGLLGGPPGIAVGKSKILLQKLLNFSEVDFTAACKTKEGGTRTSR